MSTPTHISRCDLNTSATASVTSATNTPGHPKRAISNDRMTAPLAFRPVDEACGRRRSQHRGAGALNVVPPSEQVRDEETSHHPGKPSTARDACNQGSSKEAWALPRAIQTSAAGRGGLEQVRLANG